MIPRSADVLCCPDRASLVAGRDETDLLLEWRTDLLGPWEPDLAPPDRTLLAIRAGAVPGVARLRGYTPPALIDLDLEVARGEPELAALVQELGGFLSSHRLGNAPSARLLLAERVAGACKLAFEAGPELELVPPQTFLSPMGRFGELHRVRDSGLGRPRLRYVRRLRGGATAVGQPAWEELARPAPTALAALLGRDIDGSLSPVLHNRWGLGFGRGLARLPATPPQEALGLADTLGLDGFAVTSPYKRAALAAADEASELAQRVGAANTLVRRPEGGWRAENTDVGGARASLRLFLREGGTVHVVGAGGAAAAVVVACQDQGLAVRVFARTTDRPPLAGVAPEPLSSLGSASPPSLLVNATPAWPTELEASRAPVWDLRVRPPGLPEGARDGSLMLVVQGAAQRRLWYGESPPVAEGLAALSAALSGARPTVGRR